VVPNGRPAQFGRVRLSQGAVDLVKRQGSPDPFLRAAPRLAAPRAISPEGDHDDDDKDKAVQGQGNDPFRHSRPLDRWAELDDASGKAVAFGFKPSNLLRRLKRDQILAR
jgi:hypothetical protein